MLPSVVPRDTSIRCDKTVSMSLVFLLIPNYTLLYFVLMLKVVNP